MRIGLVSVWFNRGQATVARHLRSILDYLGHETFVLARPTKESFTRPRFVAGDDVWRQPRVRVGSDFNIPWPEYKAWADETGVEMVFFDQNEQFSEVAQLRKSGVRTIGRFVWEAFAVDDVERSGEAFDAIYSLTDCERERYAELGIDSPRVRWGCHPELIGAQAPESNGQTLFFFPGGYGVGLASGRKPTDAVVAALKLVPERDVRLLIKCQGVRSEAAALDGLGQGDPRVEILMSDLPAAEYRRLFASLDVCLAPSRWEGLGLHLYEAISFGMPIITNDNPPMNELVTDGVNGLLVPGRRQSWSTRSGIPAYEPDVEALAEAIRRLRDRTLREALAEGSRQMRSQLSWMNTVADVKRLIEDTRKSA